MNKISLKKLLWIVVVSVFLLKNISFAENSTDNKEVSSFDVETAIYDVRQLKDSMDEITKQLYTLDEKELQENIDGITEKYRETRKEIVRVINDINNTTTEVSEALKKLNLYKQQLFLATKEISQITEDIEKTKEYISKFTNFLYKTKNDFYTKDSNEIDDLKLLVNSDKVPETLANDYVIKSMLIQFDELISKLQNDESNKIKLLKRINALKVTAKEQIKNYQDQIVKLQEKKNYLLQFIELYKNDRFRSQAVLNSLFNSRKEVDMKIKNLVLEIKEKKYKSVSFNVNDKLIELAKASDKIQDNQKTTHIISWPIYPVEDIQTYFDDPVYAKKYWISHNGIQIEVNQWSTVYASKDWIVYYISDHESWVWISWMLIVHENGYITTYMYLNKIIVKVWDVVMEWQPIWYSGWEPWTKWAWFISGWPNLTFWVFKNWNAVDPLNLLDLSVIKNKDNIQDKYSVSYLNDKYARPIDITELTFMSWNDVDTRADNFINTYAVWIYRELPFWEDVVDETNIDRDMVICVAFAESTLWHYLTTDWNIWNVWNNDRWDRVSFSSAFAGARAIPDTLNNRNLWYYYTINELSRYDNQNGKIYASSPINRQTNVLKCLSQIKWYYVPEDFPFRIGPNPNVSKWEKEEFQKILNEKLYGTWTN